jgi:hypothetical protein
MRHMSRSIARIVDNCNLVRQHRYPKPSPEERIASETEVLHDELTVIPWTLAQYLGEYL